MDSKPLMKTFTLLLTRETLSVIVKILTVALHASRIDSIVYYALNIRHVSNSFIKFFEN